MNKLSHFSLFSGIGGIDLAAEQAGFKTVGMCEIDGLCRKVLGKHWPDVPKWGDVFELTGKEIIETCGTIDLLSGGFPCQPFSTAGKRQGKKDERYLWPEMLRIIREVKPRWVLGENVRGLLSIDNNRTFGTILKDLAESGYRVGWLCYGAGDVGAPHKRERVFIVAYSGGGGFSKPDFCGKQQGGTKTLSASEGSRLLAHASCQLLNRPGNPGQTGRDELADSSISDTEKPGLQGTDSTGDICSRGCTPQHGQGGWEAGGKTAQPGLGGVLNGFPCGMDGTKWPAGPGEQYEWEPPRVATGIKDRVARLKALGNSVVPAQVYPILKAIAEIERQNVRVMWMNGE